MSFLKEIKRDSVFTQLLEVSRSISENFDHRKLTREAKTIHASRKSRNLYKVALEPSKLYEAATDDLAARSRLTELKAALFQNLKGLEKALEETESHLSAKFSEDLRAAGKTVLERKVVMQKILSEPVKVSKDISSALDLLDIYIKDIDQASYSLQRCVDLAKLVVERKIIGV